MKKPLIIHSIISILCIILALVAYHFYIKQSLYQDIEQQTKTSIASAKKEALQESLNIERVIQAVKSVVAQLRVNIDIYIAERGELPKTLADLDYNEPWQPHPALERVEMLHNLVFILHFRPEYGIAGTVKLAVKNPEQMGVENGNFIGTRFDCTSADFAFISDYLPECQYEPK